MSAPVPSKTTVLVVGGGPAGSYAASVLARRNIDVTVLEAAKFPRYHIGESLLASTNYFLEYIGVREKVLSHGFVRKPGGAFKLRKDFPAAYTNFVDHNTGNHALNVVSDTLNVAFRTCNYSTLRIVLNTTIYFSAMPGLKVLTFSTSIGLLLLSSRRRTQIDLLPQTGSRRLMVPAAQLLLIISSMPQVAKASSQRNIIRTGR